MNRVEVIAGALLDYSPTDEEGIFVNVSRQACEEAADLLKAAVPQPFETAPRDGPDILGLHEACSVWVQLWWNKSNTAWHKGWVRSIDYAEEDPRDYSHWLPMPPDPEG